MKSPWPRADENKWSKRPPPLRKKGTATGSVGPEGVAGNPFFEKKGFPATVPKKVLSRLLCHHALVEAFSLEGKRFQPCFDDLRERVAVGLDCKEGQLAVCLSEDRAVG